MWIDHFRDRSTPETRFLEFLLAAQAPATCELVVAEVLQGIESNREFERVREQLEKLEFILIGGQDIAIEAARNYRRLRALGITVRKTIDTLIATRCIEDGHDLLFADRDFEPFVTHLGLHSALPKAPHLQ